MKISYILPQSLQNMIVWVIRKVVNQVGQMWMGRNIALFELEL